MQRVNLTGRDLYGPTYCTRSQKHTRNEMPPLKYFGLVLIRFHFTAIGWLPSFLLCVRTIITTGGDYGAHLHPAELDTQLRVRNRQAKQSPGLVDGGSGFFARACGAAVHHGRAGVLLARQCRREDAQWDRSSCRYPPGASSCSFSMTVGTHHHHTIAHRRQNGAGSVCEPEMCIANGHIGHHVHF